MREPFCPIDIIPREKDSVTSLDSLTEAMGPENGPVRAEAKRYHFLKRTADLAGLALGLVYMAVLAFGLGPFLGHKVHGWMGGNRWLYAAGVGFVCAAGLELLMLPLDFWSGFILEHRFKLSNQTLGAWIWRRVKGNLVTGPFGLLLLWGLYGLLWFSKPWWLWAAAGWLLVTLVLGRLLPVVILPLFYKVTPLDDEPLRERLRRLAEGTGLALQGVYRLHLSAETRKANAALTGLGRSRRVLLGDTLLDQFTPEEVEVVFAHEVGHHVHHHLPKIVVVSVFLTAGGLWLADVILRHSANALGYPAFDDPAALPLLLLVLGVFGLLLSPALNGLSRHFERQCDHYALIRTGNPAAYRAAFLKLARMNKSDMEPHPLMVWLFDDHPPIRQRLLMAETVPPA